MTNKQADVSPFLLRFGEKLDAQSHARSRQDPVRQITQVEVDGAWVDAVDVHDVVLGAATKITDVKRETTDDN
jgi:hypothetical protein